MNDATQMNNQPQNGTPQQASAPAKTARRRTPPKEAAETGRVWTGERVTVGEGHPAPPEVPSAPPAAIFCSAAISWLIVVATLAR